MRASRWITAFALAFGLAVASCSSDSTGPAPSGTTTVTLGDNFFGPPNVTVTAGTTVKWTNGGSSSHTTTADDASWNSGTLAPGASFSQKMNTKGTFAYHCNFHPEMVGTVVVQ